MQRDDYTIALICALPEELAAAGIILDETHDNLPRLPSDDNIYTLGKIGKHNVVIACLPAGCIGLVSAATVATQLRTSFPSIEFGLMLGIGGGVPSQRHDIRLGDIVVSQPTGTFGGVIQYDSGKMTREGVFVPTGQVNRPPAILLSAVSKLRANHAKFGHHLCDSMMPAATEFPSLYTYPGAEQDNLFQAEYDHYGNSPTCASCDTKRLELRDPRPVQTPAIHYGLIASGNLVMRHGTTRDEWGRKLGILCFEMEAAGLMDCFPCLVVRGICDYADSHKNKVWQPYAALAAAGYVKELLDVVPIIDTAGTRLAAQRLHDHSKLCLHVEVVDFKALATCFTCYRALGVC